MRQLQMVNRHLVQAHLQCPNNGKPPPLSSDGEGFMEAYSSMAKSSGYTEETLNLSMTAKQPPSYDGKDSWLRYEELVARDNPSSNHSYWHTPE